MSTMKLIFGLDVGSSKVVSLVGALGDKVNISSFSSYHFSNANRKNELEFVHNGLICDIERTGSRITQCIHEAQYNADCSAGSLIVNASGMYVKNVYSQIRQDLNSHVVSEEIIRNMVMEARRMPIPNNYEVLDYEIQEYQIDDEHYAKNPLELMCENITANVNLFVGAKAPLSNLRRAIRYSNYEIAKIVPAGILSAMAVLNLEEKDSGCCLLDIGAGTTDLVVYENGFVRLLLSIPLGGEDITRDIVSVLRVSRNLAEDLKLTYGACRHNTVKQPNDTISFIDHRGENVSISHKLLNDVISERVKDILTVVKTQLKNNDLYDIINSGIVITGGTALLNGIQDFTYKFFEMPVRIGVPRYSGDFSDIVCNPKYATVVGSLYFAQELFLGSSFENEEVAGIEFNSIIKKIKNIFKNM